MKNTNLAFRRPAMGLVALYCEKAMSRLRKSLKRSEDNHGSDFFTLQTLVGIWEDNSKQVGLPAHPTSSVGEGTALRYAQIVSQLAHE